MLRVNFQNMAFYSPSTDSVSVPRIEQYENPDEYYSTLFHEMVHSTGHVSRLNRFEDGVAAFGNDDYSKEELVAEMGSCFLCGTIGISTDNSFRNSSAYIGSWLSKLKGDKRLVVTASSKAEAAIRYIQNGKEQQK